MRPGHGQRQYRRQRAPVYEVVQRLAGERLKAIWSLQHGFFIDKQDNMVLSPSFFWSGGGVEVRSLYGEKLLPEEDWLEGIEAPGRRSL